MGNNKFKILIVEDEANIRSFIKANLETSDYQVLCAETCALGMMMYASHHPDLIVLDLGLPDRASPASATVRTSGSSPSLQEGTLSGIALHSFRPRLLSEEQAIDAAVVTEIMSAIHVPRVTFRQCFLCPAAGFLVILKFYELRVREKALQADCLILIMQNSCAGMADDDNIILHFRYPPRICPRRSKDCGSKSSC